MSDSNQTSAVSSDGLRRLPAPHDRVEFRIGSFARPGFASMKCTVEYYGTVEDLVSASVVTAEMIGGRSRGRVTRRDAAGGRIHVRFLKDCVAVHFDEALERGLLLPGITAELVAAATFEAVANYKRRFREMDQSDEVQLEALGGAEAEAATVEILRRFARPAAQP